MEEQKTETLEEQKMRLKAEEMVKSADPKDQLVGSLYLNVQHVISKLWSDKELNEKIREKHIEFCSQCVFKKSLDQKSVLKERGGVMSVVRWATSSNGMLFILIVFLIVFLAAKDGIHLGNELKALPGISHLEK